MHELGNVQYAAQGTRALKPPRNEMPDPTKDTATIKIADHDAAVAVIRYPWQTEDVQKDNRYPDAVFSASRSTEAEPGPKAITPTSEKSRYHVYSDPGKLQVKLADEIKAINAYDGFLLGVYDKIEKFSRHTEFSLEQVLDVEQRMGELYETLELYRFTLKRIKSQALKALRCQGNLGPQRALHLLKESISKHKTSEVPEQAVSAGSPGTEQIEQNTE